MLHCTHAPAGAFGATLSAHPRRKRLALNCNASVKLCSCIEDVPRRGSLYYPLEASTTSWSNAMLNQQRETT
eukprot:1076105-Amphidinium_carterae.1